MRLNDYFYLQVRIENLIIFFYFSIQINNATFNASVEKS